MTGYPGGVGALAERISRSSIPEPMSGCVLWTGGVTSNGYGVLAYRDSDTKVMTGMLAHRASYRVTKGEIPPGHDLDHQCRVRSCINADHLKPSTRSENIRRTNSAERCVEMARRRAAAPTCKRGHQWTPENTYRSPSRPNEKSCRACHRARQLQWAAKQ